jgi:hypothetical protein
MADNNNQQKPVAKVEEAPKVEAPKVEAKTAPAKAEKETAFYETTGEFQLYDVNTNITVPHDGKAELNSNSGFVIRNLELKKLKKVG